MAYLLPLYINKQCNQSSTKAIEQHLCECESCRMICEDLKNNANIKSNERSVVLKFPKKHNTIRYTMIHPNISKNAQSVKNV